MLKYKISAASSSTFASRLAKKVDHGQDIEIVEGLVGWDHPVQLPCHWQECLPLEQVVLWTSESIPSSATGSKHSLEEEF